MRASKIFCFVLLWGVERGGYWAMCSWLMVMAKRLVLLLFWALITPHPVCSSLLSLQLCTPFLGTGIRLPATESAYINYCLLKIVTVWFFSFIIHFDFYKLSQTGSHEDRGMLVSNKEKWDTVFSSLPCVCEQGSILSWPSPEQSWKQSIFCFSEVPSRGIHSEWCWDGELLLGNCPVSLPCFIFATVWEQWGLDRSSVCVGRRSF